MAPIQLHQLGLMHNHQSTPTAPCSAGTRQVGERPAGRLPALALPCSYSASLGAAAATPRCPVNPMGPLGATSNVALQHDGDWDHTGCLLHEVCFTRSLCCCRLCLLRCLLRWRPAALDGQCMDALHLSLQGLVHLRGRSASSVIGLSAPCLDRLWRDPFRRARTSIGQFL
jgi:hypothetical protein